MCLSLIKKFWKQVTPNCRVAAIEFAKSKTNVYISSQWATVIHMVRRNNPYVVVPLKYWDIIDFKSIQKGYYKSMDTNTKGKKIKWRDIVHNS